MYNLDPNAAKLADNFHAKIEEKGKYLGVFTRAEPITSKKGATGIDLSFKSASGETADYLTVWTHGADGKQIMGFNTLMAIMTCLRIKTIAPEAGEIEKWNKDKNAMEKVSTPLFKTLMNTPIGLLLRMEEYPKNAGGTGWKPTIEGVFDKDEFTASEILEKAITQVKLAKMVQALKNKPLKASPADAATPSNNYGAGGMDNFDSDLPF